MTPDIIRKLAGVINAGIRTEVQVVYLLVGIRKLIERKESGERYPSLKFHCDWALHPKMDRRAARLILLQFDAAYARMRGSIRLRDLPADLRGEIDRLENEVFRERNVRVSRCEQASEVDGETD